MTRASRRALWALAGAVTVFAVGLAGGTALSRWLFEAGETTDLPKLSAIATPPDKLKLDASTPPIGLSPVPIDRASASSQLPPARDAGAPSAIPWANPYPAHPFVLEDQDGRQVSLKDFLGKVVLVNFIYTHCTTTCPLETQELKKLQEALGGLMGREVVFLSVTIDPKRDTPQVLKRYGGEHGADFRSWKFLTGPEAKIRAVLEAYRVPVTVERRPGAPEGAYELGHGNPVYLIDQWGRVRKRTAPTMLVQIGRPAIEWLVRAGAGDVDADDESERPRTRRRR